MYSISWRVSTATGGPRGDGIGEGRGDRSGDLGERSPGEEGPNESSEETDGDL